MPIPFWSRFATPLYKNTGSVARDHLASERTFLAWIRTGLGFVALGIAVERFSQLDLTELIPHPPSTNQEEERDRRLERQRDKDHSHILVFVLMAMGSGSILYGTGRYFTNLRALESGLFRPAFHGAAVMGAAVAGLAGGVFGSTMARRKPERDVVEGR